MVRESISRRRYLKVTGAAGVAGLAGCTGQGGNDGGQDTTTTSTTTTTTTMEQSQQGGTIHFLNDRSGREIWEAAAEEFSSNSDYDVEITWLPKGTAVNEQISKMEAAGNLPALIFETSADCYSETLGGKTAPMTDVVEELGVKDTVNVDGESYMVPVVSTPLTMIYRTDVIEGNPRTWSEWQSEAERIQNQQGQAAYAVPAGRTNAATTHTNQILWNSGVDPYAGSGEDVDIVIDEGENRERAIAAFDWLQTMNELGPQASGWEWGDFVSALIQEQLVGWAGLGGLAIQQIQANRPDLVSQFTPAPFPVAEGQDPTQWWSYFEGIYSYEAADNIEGAKEFVKFFLTSDYYFEWLRMTAPFSFPTAKDAIRDERYTSAEIYQNGQSAFLDLVENNWESMAPVLNTGDDGAPNAVAADAYAKQLYGQAADQLLYGNRSSEETVDWLAEQLRQI